MTIKSLVLLCVIALLGTTTLLPAADSIEDVMAGTFRITDKKNGSGTGFLVRVPGEGQAAVGRLVLVTAAHNVQQFKGDECWIILREKQNDETHVRREHRLALRDGDRVLWKKHPSEDIAVMPLELPPMVDVSPFRLEQVATTNDVTSRRVKVAQESWVPGFPAQLEANPAGWPVLRRGVIASHPLTPVASVRTFLINVSSFGGDSGAPVVVFLAGERDQTGQAPAPKPMVAGMVLGMHRQTDKTVTPFEERTHHTPLDISIVIQAPLIRETIDLLKLPSP